MKKKVIYTREQFIRFIDKEVVKKGLEPTLEKCESALEKVTLGADGVSIALTILWIRKDIKEQSKRNIKSDKKLIVWLKSNMRAYANYGCFDPFVRDVVNRYFECRKEELKEQLSENNELEV